MEKSKPTGTAGGADGVTVDFGSRFAESKLFLQVFAEGMALVEETANYLDGEGRQDARGLSRHAAIAYASESMRLTTRLMQLASWLLLRRAVNEGEMTLSEAEREEMQTRVEKIHSGWTKDDEYLAPPAVGTLAEIDPALIVTPPAGLEIGYVPIVTRQGPASK